MARPNQPVPWDVEGPVRGEIFLVWLNGDRLELTGPDGPVPWIVQLDDVEHPVESADRIMRGLVGPPLLAHSTSWRRVGAAVLLTFANARALHIRCACGWEATGSEEEVVAAATDHGEQVHNMRPTWDEVLAMAVSDSAPS